MAANFKELYDKLSPERRARVEKLVQEELAQMDGYNRLNQANFYATSHNLINRWNTLTSGVEVIYWGGENWSAFYQKMKDFIDAYNRVGKP